MSDMEITRIDGEEFLLFLDIFVHWSGRKITATAAYYDDDIVWLDHGVDLNRIELIFGPHRVLGRYIPHRLDTLEPCVLFDFEAPALEAVLRENKSIAFTVRAGSHSKQFCLETKPAPGHEIAMSIIVRDCNRWIPYFFDYYLQCLDCDHIYVYDNYTSDQKELQRIVQPYIDDGRATYIPWHYRWRNKGARKQTGQIPQQAHSLNKFGQCNWIGFLDYDEFLRVPGQSLKQFLKGYDPATTDGLSFGTRWFMYKGDKPFEEAGNPLLNFLHSKPDVMGRKRQKLIVSPKNVRFLRIHWLEEGKRDIPIDDTNIFYHHYYLMPFRFEQGKNEHGTTRDDYMLGFAETLVEPARGIAESPAKQRPSKPKSTEEWITHVIDAFRIAEAEVSNLPDDVLQLDGYCGRYNRQFLNALCAFENCRYLEIGGFKGASLCAAMHDNHLSAVAIENWSQFGGPREVFMAAVTKHRGACNLRVVEQDCFAVNPADLGTFDVYYYDGDHSTDNQDRAIRHFYDSLTDQSVVIIDDWNWKGVREGTYRAISELDIPVIFEKEIILPEADTVDMPRHRGRETWWNGIYVMIIDKQAMPVSKSTRKRAIAPTSARPVAKPSPLEVIVFSKDRACQLEALLRSIECFLETPHRITVLYTASDQMFQAGYDLLMGWHKTVNWRREEEFRPDLLRLVADASVRDARNVMFLVDDIIFTRNFDSDQMMPLLDDDEVLALALRLGDTIQYCHPRTAATVPPDFLPGRRWAWRDAHPGYWNYPMSLDGNIFRLDDMAKILSGIEFQNPNTLEACLARNPINRPHLACQSSPCLVNLALNLVQNIFNNPHGNTSAADLNNCFLSGFVIDITPFQDKEFAACHIEPEITLIRNSRSVPTDALRTVMSGQVGVTTIENKLPFSALVLHSVPILNPLISIRQEGNVLLVKQQSEQEGLRLNETGCAIWSLCNGQNPVDAICESLEDAFAGDANAIRRDVVTTLRQLESHGLLTLSHNVQPSERV